MSGKIKLNKNTQTEMCEELIDSMYTIIFKHNPHLTNEEVFTVIDLFLKSEV